MRTKVPNASGRHMPTYDSCLVTLTGLVLRVLPRLALRVRTRATYACLASTCWLSITLGALLSADTAGSHFYGGNTAGGCRESALCFTAVSQAQRRRACVCRTRRGLRARVRAQASRSAPPGACGPCCAVKFVMCAACPLVLARCARVSAPARLWVWLCLSRLVFSLMWPLWCCWWHPAELRWSMATACPTHRRGHLFLLSLHHHQCEAYVLYACAMPGYMRSTRP